jgi:hypothetical protein
MKRLNLLMACLGLGVLAITAQPGEAGQKKNKPTPIDPPPAKAAASEGDFGDFMEGIFKAAASEDPASFLNGMFKFMDMEKTREASATEASVVAQLIEILNETKSPQTVLAATLALMPMGKKAQSAVPAIIRNAERLKVFAPLKDINSAKAENATVILTAVMAIQMDLQLNKDTMEFPGNPLGVGRTPYGYGPLPVVPAPPPMPSYSAQPPSLIGPACPAGPLTTPSRNVYDPLGGCTGERTGPVQPPCRVNEPLPLRGPSSVFPPSCPAVPRN